MSYLTVKGKHLDGIMHYGETYPCPSQILPGIEYVKNAERSLGGKLHVDISDSKQTLQVVFDMLNPTDFKKIKTIFEVESPDPDGLPVEYFANEMTEEEAEESSPESNPGPYEAVDYSDEPTPIPCKFFVQEFTYYPLVTENGILWRDVTVNLVEV